MRAQQYNGPLRRHASALSRLWQLSEAGDFPATRALCEAIILKEAGHWERLSSHYAFEDPPNPYVAAAARLRDAYRSLLPRYAQFSGLGSPTPRRSFGRLAATLDRCLLSAAMADPAAVQQAADAEETPAGRLKYRHLLRAVLPRIADPEAAEKVAAYLSPLPGFGRKFDFRPLYLKYCLVPG
ncbi:MAG TPA: hypothetical protein VJB16_05330, partial [archaeon]|nr:hypothetical protein [archaeon]